MARYTIRLAVADDAEVLSAIAARTFQATFGHLYADADMRAYLTQAYEVEKMRGEINDEKTLTVLLFPEGDSLTPCGYSMVIDECVRPQDKGPAEDFMQIKRIYIDKAHHGTGAAHQLMKFVMEHVREKNRKIVWLCVWVKNFRAQKFYQRYGFVETGMRMFHVGNDENPDFIYTLERRAGSS